MSWKNTIKKRASKKQRVGALSHIIRKYESEVEEFQYNNTKEYYERVFKELENKDLNDDFPKEMQKEILEFYEEESDLMWKKKQQIIPALKSLRSFIEEFDTEE